MGVRSTVPEKNRQGFKSGSEAMLRVKKMQQKHKTRRGPNNEEYDTHTLNT